MIKLENKKAQIGRIVTSIPVMIIIIFIMSGFVLLSVSMQNKKSFDKIGMEEVEGIVSDTVYQESLGKSLELFALNVKEMRGEITEEELEVKIKESLNNAQCAVSSAMCGEEGVSEVKPSLTGFRGYCREDIKTIENEMKPYYSVVGAGFVSRLIEQNRFEKRIFSEGDEKCVVFTYIGGRDE